MYRPNCPECERLWTAYATAIRQHIRLEYKLRGVALEDGDLGELRELVQEVDAADDVRANSREALQLHEATVHGSAASAV